MFLICLITVSLSARLPSPTHFPAADDLLSSLRLILLHFHEVGLAPKLDNDAATPHQVHQNAGVINNEVLLDCSSLPLHSCHLAFDKV